MVHSKTQPGLHEHSHRPEDDLMKPFIVWRRTTHGGWLGVESTNTLLEAQIATLERRNHPERYPGTPTHPSAPQTYRITHDHPNGKRYLFVYIGENADGETEYLNAPHKTFPLTIDGREYYPTYLPYDLIHTTTIKNY